MSLRLHVMVTKNSDFFVSNDCSYGQLTKIQNFYLSLRLWSNRERFLAFQLLNSRESKFGDICGDKCLGLLSASLKKIEKLCRKLKHFFLQKHNSSYSIHYSILCDHNNCHIMRYIFFHSTCIFTNLLQPPIKT
jgi:hypothetical protein